MSFEKWETKQWGDLATLEYGKSLRDYSDSLGKVPVFGTNGPIGFTDVPLCNQAGIIIGRKGAYRGVHFSAEPFFVIDTAFYLKPKTSQLDIKFAYYQLLTQDINGLDSGSAIPSTSREDFYGLELMLPPLATQRRIAALLTALDDKIELNRRMNETLEGLAQAVWGEWFGGYLAGEGLPEGWRWGKLKEMFRTTSGGTPSRDKPEFYENGTIEWVKSKELKDFFVVETEEKITDLALKSSSAKLLPAKSVLIAMYGATVGEVSILSKEASCNQAICAVVPNSNHPYSFIFQFLKNEKERLKNLAVGAAQQNISQDLIQNIELPIPSTDVLKRYQNLVEPIFDKILENLRQSNTLSSLRDSLLPKLMSGQILI